MASMWRKIACSRVCHLVLLFGVLLFLTFPLDTAKIRYSVVKEYMGRLTEKPKQPLWDSLLVELQESLDQIAQHSKIPQITKSDRECYFKDRELQRRRCPAGIRSDCIQESLSKDLTHRLEDLMNNEHLKIAPQYRELLHDLEKQIEGHYHLVIVSALSSNHYLESQAMLREVHEKIFPIVPNSKLVVYDLGLTDEEREEYQKLCRCKLLRLPIEKLPPFCSTLRCFCWKPFVVRAHLANGDMVMWMDASIRFTNPEKFLDALRRTEMYGVQQNYVITQLRIPFHALPPMFHHYGFTPCAFNDYHGAASNWAIYRNSPLIEHAVLDIWAACGLNKTCTCSGPYGQCEMETNRKYAAYCQRPQTAIAIILARLWMESYGSVATVQDSFDIWRGHRLHYFQILQSSEQNSVNPTVIPVNS